MWGWLFRPGTRPKVQPSQKRTTCKPDVQVLEDRCMPATVSLTDGVLRVFGTGNFDTINLTQSGGVIFVQGDPGSYPIGTVTKILIKGGRGGDTISLGTGSSAVTLPARIMGGSGPDIITGGTAADKILGGGQKDRLLGGDGRDTLKGGGGPDILFGGLGGDRLSGGGGTDRFLSQAGDRALDKARVDARINFVNGNATWTDQEILLVDIGLERLQNRTGNTRLLKLPFGRQLRFVRMTDLSGALADNDSRGNIRFASLLFTSYASSTWETVIHEIGHNWDTFDAREPNRFFRGFLSLSGWTQSPPNFFAYTSTFAYGELWYYQTSASFATSYARSHPAEDWSESFAAAFGGLGSSNIPAKLQLINRWLNRLRR
jgi:hypothetical protein